MQMQNMRPSRSETHRGWAARLVPPAIGTLPGSPHIPICLMNPKVICKGAGSGTHPCTQYSCRKGIDT